MRPFHPFCFVRSSIDRSVPGPDHDQESRQGSEHHAICAPEASRRLDTAAHARRPMTRVLASFKELTPGSYRINDNRVTYAKTTPAPVDSEVASCGRQASIESCAGTLAAIRQQPPTIAPAQRQADQTFDMNDQELMVAQILAFDLKRKRSVDRLPACSDAKLIKKN